MDKMNKVEVLYRNYDQEDLRGEVSIIGEEKKRLIEIDDIKIDDTITPGKKITLLPYLQTADFKGNEKVDRKFPGLYFCANVKNDGTLLPPPTSPYGKHRIIININDLNLTQYIPYFFNSYTLPNNGQTYAIIALVLEKDLEKFKQHSESPPKFKIERLDWKKNEYLFQENEKTWYVSGTLWVELFIINEITIQGWDYKDNIIVTGRAKALKK